MAGRIDGVALASVGAGALLMYAGITGKDIPAALRAMITGKSPSTAPKTRPIQQVTQEPLGSGPSTTPIPVSSAPSSTVPAVSGGTYTTAQLQQLWIANGGDPAQARNAACHAMQESSGRSWVTSPNPDGGTNVGLWQLDTKGVGAGYTVAQLQNPDFNAQLTVMATANGTNWSQWSTPGCP